jgi:large subunit ribosomal protein L31
MDPVIIPNISQTYNCHVKDKAHAISVDEYRFLGYHHQVMKTAIHPQLFETTVHCNGCNTTFTAHSTVKEISVEICSNCHPFYTGKQKLVDTAGRVDKFMARRAKATKAAEDRAERQNRKDTELAKVQAELQKDTVDAPTTQEA